jgi:hypothetical protein
MYTVDVGNLHRYGRVKQHKINNYVEIFYRLRPGQGKWLFQGTLI